MIEVVDEVVVNNVTTQGTAREKTEQAIHYYNNNVLKSRTSSSRSPSTYSYQQLQQHHQLQRQQQQQKYKHFERESQKRSCCNSSNSNSVRGGVLFNTRVDNLYRSNSSLELLHDSNNLNDYHYGGGRGGSSSQVEKNNSLIGPKLKREYGSHGSIDVIAIADYHPVKGGGGTDKNDASEQFLSMLQDYKPTVFDLLKNNSSSNSNNNNNNNNNRHCDKKPAGEYVAIGGNDETNNKKSENQSSSGSGSSGGGVNLLNKQLQQHQQQQQQQQQQFDTTTYEFTPYTNGKCGTVVGATSPKQKSKFPRFWSSTTGTSGGSNNNDSATGDLLVMGSSPINHHQSHNLSTSNSGNAINVVVDVDEKQRRRAFAHYDCQSLVAKLGYGSKLKNLLSKRRNTTTGASAASMLSARSSTPDGDSGEEDIGDGRSNDLIESCPFFRNEIGGEEERIVSLTRAYSPSYTKHRKEPHHRPRLSCGVSILEYPIGETHWLQGICPYRRNLKTIENVDEGALYYRKYFYKQDHQNWFGTDESLGPVAISIKREKVEAIASQNDNNNSSTTSTITNSNNSSNGNNTTQLCRYRLIVRTSELQTLRGSVLEDTIPNLKPSHNFKTINTKEILEYVVPEVQLSCLRLGVNSLQVEEQLLKLDEQGISRYYKIGVLYCRAGQSTEEEMYNNEEGGPAFNEFLETIGQKVRLKGFDKYKAGLDNKSDSTGLYSVYAQYKDCEIMFHVSTLLPFTPNNRQQLLRKRHIGNDIVTIVFQEPGAHPFTPKNIRSQFQHVFIIIRAVNPCTESTQYRIAVTRSKDVALFGPPVPKGAIFNKSKSFTEFLLAKVINGENAAHCSDKFATMATRTRQAYLKDLTTNCTSSTLLESSQKFSIMSFSSKKKERWKPRFVPDATQRGAICWQVMLEDSTQSIIIHCYLAISCDSLVLINENTNEIVFVTPCKSILGWSTQTNSLRLYYHEGECITMHMRECGDRDELMEVIDRLKSVTPGWAAQELSLKRNLVGQLGFHVQPDGVVTQVENMGFAWQTGLRQGARLVEICKVAVATLTHDQMVDLLKTSLMVTVTVIPPLSDGSVRRGCFSQTCKYNSIGEKEDYDSGSSPEDQKSLTLNTASLQQPVIAGKHKKMYERSFSPPRSSNSSGYGTGSSNKSFGGSENKLFSNTGSINSAANNETPPISLSSNVFTEESRWYDVLDTESLPVNLRNNMSPPPLPSRVLSVTPTSSSSISPNSRSPVKYTVHSKVKLSSLPFSNANSYSLPVVLNSNNDVDLTGVDFMGDKATCLIKAEHSHKVRKQLEKKLYSGIMVDDFVGSEDNVTANLITDTTKLCVNDTHLADKNSSNEKSLMRNEDEYSVESGSCGNDSPKLRSAVRYAATGNYSNCSRNNSPRLKDVSEARLRPGVTSRSSNRNSANLMSNTLQQDLLKLISPDYAAEDNQNIEEVENGISQNSNIVAKAIDSINQKTSKNGTNSVLVMTARPATVISNAIPPQGKDNFLPKEERLSLRMLNSKHDTPCLPLPDTKEMDWPSLVDTATKAMSQTNNESVPSSLLSSASQTGDDYHWVDSTDEFHFNMASDIENKKTSQQQFQKYLSELENRLMKETQKRLNLEQEVHSLRDENRKLQLESQSAAQQLRRFTEWFFQTIDKQQ